MARKCVDMSPVWVNSHYSVGEVTGSNVGLSLTDRFYKQVDHALVGKVLKHGNVVDDNSIPSRLVSYSDSQGVDCLI